MAFLERYLSILTRSQVADIRRQIEERAKSGEIRSQEQFNKELSSAILEVSTDNTPKTVAPTFTPLSKTDADLYNEFCSSALVDLRSLFRESNYSDFLIGLEEASSKDFTDTINAAIKSLRGVLAARRENYRYSGSVGEIFFEGFDDPATRELRGVVYNNGVMSLETRNAQNRIFDIEKVEILRYPRAGAIYVVNSEFNPETNPKVLAPGSFRGYWAETALVDAMPVMKFQNDPEIPYNRSYSGILAIARVTFTTPISLNSLNIDPYTDFPIEIPWLRYRVTRSGSWNHVTRSGQRFTTSTSKSVHLFNLDRVTMSVLEIPILQQNSSMTNTIITQHEEMQMDYLQSTLENDTRELEYELDKYLTVKTQNVDYRRAVASILRSENVDTAIRDVFDIVGVGKKAIQPSSDGFIGLDSDCPSCIVEAKAFDKGLKHSFVYGLFGISPLSVNYSRKGVHKSPLFDTVSKQIVSAVLTADFETPDISSVNFFVELESGRKLPIAPDGTTLFREHIPIGRDITGYPKAYFVDASSNEEFIPNRRNLAEIQINRVFPSFFMKSPLSASTVKLYRNGILIPYSSYSINSDERYIDLAISTTDPLLAPFGSEDEILVEYTIDPEYEAPRHLRFNSPRITPSGDILMSFNTDLYEFNTSKSYALHISSPDNQWYKLNSNEYYITNNSLIVSGSILGTVFPSFEGIVTDFQFYSFNPSTKGNVGRRDFSGSPYRVDLISSVTERIGNTTDLFNIVSKRFTGKYRLANYIIELQHIPLIDYNLYKYDGTWNNEPGTGNPYIPILVRIGSGENVSTAVDITPYKSEEVPYLNPYEEVGFYQFYLRGNILYFNSQSCPMDITVSYEHLGSSIRLVTELNTNRPGSSDYTPLVKDYTLRLGVLE